MGIFDDGFSNQDAAIIGGIMGFAEEAMREEARELEEDELEEKLIELDHSRGKIDLLAFKKQNPELFRRIVHIIVAQRRRWAEDRRAFEEVKDELTALNRCEAMLNEEQK